MFGADDILARYNLASLQGDFNQTAYFRLALILAQQVAGLQHRPPVTLTLSAIIIALFAVPKQISQALSIQIPDNVRTACLNPAAIVINKQWARLFWSPLLHLDELHVYYNVASFLSKGSQLEPRLGAVRFVALLTEMALVSQIIFIALAKAAFPRGPNFHGCVVGFSGVLFALKVVVTHNAPGWGEIFGVRMPTKHLAWGELVAAQLISPGVSFWGHVSGILAGLLHLHILIPLYLFLTRRERRNRGQSSSQRVAGRRRSGQERVRDAIIRQWRWLLGRNDPWAGTPRTAG